MWRIMLPIAFAVIRLFLPDLPDPVILFKRPRSGYRLSPPLGHGYLRGKVDQLLLIGLHQQIPSP